LSHLLLHRLRQTLRALAQGIERAPLRVDGAVSVALAETALRLAHGFSGAAEVVHIALALTPLARLTLLVLAETAVLELFEQFVEAVAQGLPLPGAIAPATPWSDMTKTGDTYFANEMVDNILVSNDGWLADAASLYANGHDLKDPMLSPVYGDLQGFPPTILTSGTRDLFLSNTVRVHRKLRAAGVVADLIVFEGQSHAQYLFVPDATEAKEYFTEVTAFFDKHLEK
jgi:alpha/beta hydrolase fold